jgi:hypothetical protein
MSDDQLFSEVKMMRFTDESRTERLVSDPKMGPRHTVYTYSLEDDIDVMVCTERVCMENTGELTEGWSYEMKRVESRGGGRK